jgi:hypothetical protein
MTKKELEAKLEVLEDNGIVSQIFLHAIGLDYEGGINVGNGKKVKCYRNYSCASSVPKSIQTYIDKGYMECTKKGDRYHYWYFKVTKKGFAWLSGLLGIEVEEDD